MPHPVGTVTPLSRKREIYGICQEYNIIIIEDDAYYYLQYPDLQGMTGRMQLYICTATAQLSSPCGQNMFMQIWADCALYYNSLFC